MEDAREVRALLDLMRENETRAQYVATSCAERPGLARQHLKILDPEAEQEELIKSWEGVIPLAHRNFRAREAAHRRALVPAAISAQQQRIPPERLRHPLHLRFR